MGAWGHFLMHYPNANKFRLASRKPYGSTAAGSHTRFERRHNQVIEYVFDITKNNSRK